MKRVPRESGGTTETNSSRQNGQGATLLEPPLPQHGEALGTILAALQTMQNGDFSVRLPVAWSGLEGKIADTFNDIIGATEQMARELNRVGLAVGKEGRTRERTRFRQIRGAWGEKPFDFDGKYYQVDGATVLAPPDPLPDIYFGGSSPAAVQVAARQADVYLTWGEPPALAAEKIDTVRQAAARLGRTPRFGMRLHVITRDQSADAWAEAARLLSHIDQDEMAALQRGLAASESVGQARQLTLHAKYRDSGDPRDLEIYPGLWAGIGLLRGGAGTALVGSHDEVADLIEEYAALGIEEFILSGYPHLEEAYWFGENVLPELRTRQLRSREQGDARQATSTLLARG